MSKLTYVLIKLSDAAPNYTVAAINYTVATINYTVVAIILTVVAIILTVAAIHRWSWTVIRGQKRFHFHNKKAMI